jgi:hypothetical protein
VNARRSPLVVLPAPLSGSSLARRQVRKPREVGATGCFGAAVAFVFGEAAVGVDLVDETLIEGTSAAFVVSRAS